MKEILGKLVLPGVLVLLAWGIFIIGSNINILVSVMCIALLEFQSNIIINTEKFTFKVVILYFTKLFIIMSSLILFKLKFIL